MAKYKCIVEYEYPVDHKPPVKAEIILHGDSVTSTNVTSFTDRPHGEWIPCSERLPEENGKYLVCWRGEWGVNICFAEYSKCGKYWYDASEGSEYRGVTAWMPLPEPYKGGDEK
jgi:hypothetical protein